MNTKKSLPLIGALCLLPFGATAQEVGETRLSFGATSFGATAEVAYRFHSNLSVRGLAGGVVNISPDISLDGTTYSTSVKPQGIGLMLDWHTGLGGLRFSGGGVYSKSSASGSVTANAANPVTVGSTTLNSGETIDASLGFANEFAPMLSAGYDLRLGKSQWVLSGEIGAVFNGGYDATVTVTGAAVPAADLAAEVNSIENDINNTLKVYPYVSIMIGTTF